MNSVCHVLENIEWDLNWNVSTQKQWDTIDEDETQQSLKLNVIPIFRSMVWYIWEILSFMLYNLQIMK